MRAGFDSLARNNKNILNYIIMKKIFFFTFAFLCTVAQGAWAQTSVSTDSELRAAIQNNGANITVTSDIDLSNSTLSIESGTTVTIDLGGHTLDRKLTQRGKGGGQVITVRSGATLNLSNGTLTGGWGGAGGALVNEGGTLTITNVIITNNVADDRGGGVCNRTGGTLTMTDCSITNNHSNDKSGAKGGGGLFNEDGATAALTGVTITGNTAKLTGGGGICNFGTLTLDGCTITDNSANTSGGAIWQEGTLNMQGANIITGNTDASGKDNNVYLKSGKVITVIGSLAGSSVGITMEAAGTFTSGYNANNSGVDPATIFTPDLTGVMAVSLDGNEAKLANALPDGAVYYIERSWDEASKTVKAEIKTLASGGYTVLQSSDDPVTIQPGYYVVKGDIECERVYCKGGGKHHLILCDGAKLSTYLVGVEDDNELYIYGQSNDSGKLLVDNEVVQEFHAGIGGDDGKTVGTIVIHGGDINTRGSLGGAGIGCGRRGHDGTIVIYGGNIYAEGGDTYGFHPYNNEGAAGAGIGGGDMKNGSVMIYGGHIEAKGAYSYGAAGIGSGYNGLDEKNPLNGGVITIYGGDISATGGDDGAGIGSGDDCNGAYVTIHGGLVRAWGGGNGAGIGCGYNSSDLLTFTGELTVTGGEVYAYGSASDDAGGGGAGIGGGRDANGSKVTISGGYVYAKGGKQGAGIGSGCEALFSGGKQGGTLTVTGGEVYAYGGVDAAGIGGGEDADGSTVTISGGYVYAEGNDGGAGIGGGEEGDGGKVTITGGTVIAKAGRDETSAIGSGYDCDVNGSLTLGDDRCVYITGNLWRSKKENRVSDCWGAMYVQISECFHGGATASVVSGEKHSISNCQWCYTGEEAHTFGDDSQCPVCKLIRLEDEGDNSALFTKWADGDTHDFFLSGRKLEADSLIVNGEKVESSKAYTVCLPFDMDLSDRADDLTVWTLAYIKDGKEMVFTQTDRKIEAGKPYLIVMHKGELELLGHSPLTVKADDGVRVYDWDNREQPLGWWRGTLTKIESADAAAVMAYALQSVGDFRRIRPDTYWAWWGAFRSMYCPDELPGTNRFTINRGALGGFGSTVSFEGDTEIDGDVVGIKEITDPTPNPSPAWEGSGCAWYTLDGRKLAGQPSRAGVYIYNGIKQVVK